MGDGSHGAISGYRWQNRGEVHVYEWNGTTWNQVGNEIMPTQFDSKFGSSLSLSGDGKRLVVNSIDQNSYVYLWNDTEWQFVKRLTNPYGIISPDGSTIADDSFNEGITIYKFHQSTGPTTANDICLHCFAETPAKEFNATTNACQACDAGEMAFE